MTAVFPLIAILLAAPQAEPRIHISPNSDRSLGFEWSGKNIKGQDATAPVFRAILVYTNPVSAGANVTVIWDSPTAIDTTQTKIPLSVALVGVPSGDWDCTVALEDQAGNRGPPSLVTDKTRFTVTADPPMAPQNVGIVD